MILRSTSRSELLARFKNTELVSRAHTALRGRLQERAAEANLRECIREAGRRDIVVPEGEKLKSVLRARLAARRKGRAARAKGELHVFLSYEHESWQTILPKSLEPFGRVTAFDSRAAGYRFQNREQWLAVRDGLDAAMLAAFRKANGERPVDAVVGYLSGASTAPHVLRTMAEEGAAVFNFCWDDKLSWPGELLGDRVMSPAAIASAVDLNLTNAPHSPIKYAVSGGLAMFWPEAAHPDVHRPYETEFDFDVSFVGARYGWRPQFIERLQAAGISVTCFGRGWPNGPLSDDEMVKLYSRSRINLGFAGIGYSRKLMCLKGRDFEVPMSGGLYLTQHNPELNAVYRLGEEIVTYRDEADCATQIRDLLASPERCARIRAAGRARCLKEHTYDARWTQIFEMAGLMEPE